MKVLGKAFFYIIIIAYLYGVRCVPLLSNGLPFVLPFVPSFSKTLPVGLKLIQNVPPPPSRPTYASMSRRMEPNQK